MFSGRSLSQKICRQGQKNVIGRIIPANIQKFLIIFYDLLKMTQGCNPLASEPEPTRTPLKTICSNRLNYTQSSTFLRVNNLRWWLDNLYLI